MKAHVLEPAAVPAIAAAVGLPEAPPAAIAKCWRDVESAVESALFYGLLAVGISAPLLGALYALLFR